MIWLVVFFPLNNMQTYGNTNVNDIATYEYSPVAQNQIVDLTEPADPQNTLQRRQTQQKKHHYYFRFQQTIYRRTFVCN